MRLSILTIMFTLMSISLLKAQKKVVSEPKSGITYGQKIIAEDAIEVTDLSAKVVDEQPVAIKVKGKVADVCTKEGCWLKIVGPDGKVMVKMEDHAFAVPVSLNGKEIVIDGIAKLNITSVAELKHYAEDAGKTTEEIEAIKEPKKEIVITAKGIIVL